MYCAYCKVVQYPALIAPLVIYRDSIMVVVATHLLMQLAIIIFDDRLEWNVTLLLPHFYFSPTRSKNTTSPVAFQQLVETELYVQVNAGVSKQTLRKWSFDVRPFFLWILAPACLLWVSAMLVCVPVISRGIALGVAPDDCMHRNACVAHNMSLLIKGLSSTTISPLIDAARDCLNKFFRQIN